MKKPHSPASLTRPNPTPPPSRATALLRGTALLRAGRFVSALTGLFLTLGSAPGLHAADRYVSPNGNDANPGTSVDKPLKTLQKANSLVQPGDTVWIMAGTYRNSKTDQPGESSSLLTISTSGTPDKWITWRNYKNDKPELIAQGCWQGIELKASYIAIDGLILTGNNDNVYLSDAERNAEINVPATRAAWKAEGSMEDMRDLSATPDLSKPGTAVAPKPALKPKSRPLTYERPSPLYNGNGINCDNRNGPLYHHFRISNMVIRKFGTVGISMIDSDYYTIENCEIYDNAWYSRYGGSGFSQQLGRAFDTKPGYHNVIRNNRVWNNKSLVRVYYLDLISDGNGIILDSLLDYPGDILVENNLCFSNGGAGIHVFKSSKAHIDIVNNTLWRNQQTWHLYDMGAHAATNINFLNNIVVADKYRQTTGKIEPGIVYDYNIYYGSPANAKGPNDLFVDPRMAGPSTNRKDADFTLLPGSPGIDSGTTQLLPKTDLLGVARPQGGAPDRGAFEMTTGVQR